MNKKIRLIVFIICLISNNLFAQLDLLDTSVCIFEYGYADFSDPSKIKFVKNAEGMSPQHFTIVNNFNNLQEKTNLPEIPFEGIKAIKMMSLNQKRAAKIRIPIDLTTSDIIILYWSGWLEAPGHTPAPYADGGLSISLLDTYENYLCSGFYFANGYMEDKDVWKKGSSFIYTDKWQKLFIDTKSLLEKGYSKIFIDFAVYGCNASGHQSCIWVAMSNDKANQVKKMYCDNELILTAVDAKAYNWYKNNTLVGNTQSITVTEPGDYKVIIEPYLGCNTEYNVTITDSISNQKIVAIPRRDSALCGDSIAVDIYKLTGSDSTLLETQYIYHNGETIFFENEEYCNNQNLKIYAKFYCHECADCPILWWLWLLAFLLGLILGWLISKLFKGRYKILVVNKNNEVIRTLKNKQKFTVEKKDLS